MNRETCSRLRSESSGTSKILRVQHLVSSDWDQVTTRTATHCGTVHCVPWIQCLCWPGHFHMKCINGPPFFQVMGHLHLHKDHSIHLKHTAWPTLAHVWPINFGAHGSSGPPTQKTNTGTVDTRYVVVSRDTKDTLDTNDTLDIHDTMDTDTMATLDT